jgi:chaperone BCS1
MATRVDWGFSNAIDRMVSQSRKRFEELLLAAKLAYIAQEQDRVVVKMMSEDCSDDGRDRWRQVALKNKRDLNSVITEPGVKERIEADITEFCKSEKWYTSRGVPWRRGVLLHGT